MLPYFLYPPEMRKQIDYQQACIKKGRLAACVPWTPDIKWNSTLNIQAKSYSTLNLFPECPVIKTNNVNSVKEPGLVSPNGQWLYCVKQLPRGERLQTMCGKRSGSVLFDGPINIPGLHQKTRHGEWQGNPWMSITPMEIMTLRTGTKRAKGVTVVAGLGLGHQLIEVSKRKQVKELILVEQSQGLVDWILPRVVPHLERPLDQVIVGDAYQELPKLTADVALVDIFQTYGGNREERGLLQSTCFGIKTIWCWGSAG